jgi:hypothetical protein
MRPSISVARSVGTGLPVATLGLIFLILLLSSASEAQQRAKAPPAIAGELTDSSGRPIPFAYVFVDGLGTTIANSEGQFRFAQPVSATYVKIGVRRIGFQRLDTLVQMNAEVQSRLRFVLRSIANELNPVVVNEKGSGYDDYLDRAGYYQRMARNVDGTFISARDIEKRSPLTVTALMRDVSGTRVVSRGGRGGKNDFVVGRGGTCALGLVVDGLRVEINNPPIEATQPRITSIIGSRQVAATESRRGLPTDPSLDEMVNPSMVAAIEVYPSAASVPTGLHHHSDGCGLIVVWTRHH